MKFLGSKEKAIINQTLAQFGGNASKMAEAMGCSPQAVINWAYRNDTMYDRYWIVLEEIYKMCRVGMHPEAIIETMDMKRNENLNKNTDPMVEHGDDPKVDGEASNSTDEWADFEKLMKDLKKNISDMEELTQKIKEKKDEQLLFDF